MVVFFDIDDTLVDSESAHSKAIKKICDEYNLSIKSSLEISSEWLLITEKYLSLYFKNLITLEEQRKQRILEFWKSFGRVISEKQAQIVYKQYHQYFLRSCCNFPDTIAVLQKLKHLKLGIISNGTYSDQIFKLENNHLLAFFDHFIISEKVGCSKPDKKIFQIAVAEADEKPSECIYVGNSFEIDYLGGLNSGMRSILVDRKSVVNNQASEKIHSLDELLSILFF